MNFAVVALAGRRDDVGDAVNHAGSHIIDAVHVIDKSDLTHRIEIKLVGEVGKSFEVGNREIGAKVVTKRRGEAK